MSRLKQAHFLVGHDWHVFPIVADGKEPAVAHGFKDATLNKNALHQWWTTGDLNIGLSTGPSRLLVLDVDVKKEDGPGSLTMLELEHGELPRTTEVRTPSGGRHYYFTLPEEIIVPSSAGRVGLGIDVRAEYGYVLAPGSTIDGKNYAWDPHRAVAEAPKWLIELAGRPRERADNCDDWLVEPDLAHNLRRAENFAKETLPAIEGRGGDEWTKNTAAVMRDFAISEPTAHTLLALHFNPRCEPPWDEEELGIKVTNAYKYPDRPAGTKATPESSLVEMQRRAEARELSVAVNHTLKDELGDVRTPPANPFTLLKTLDIKNFPDPEWLIEGALPEHSLALLYGPWGVHKTFIALDMALSVASGRPWGPLKENKMGPRPVVYLAGEGAHGFKARLNAWLEDRKVNDVPGFHLVPAMPLFAVDEQLKQLAEAITTARIRPALIVVDTVARAMAGMDENAQKDAAVFIARCDELRRAFLCALLGVHHTGKDQSRGARGSTVLPGSVDVLIRVEEAAAAHEVILHMEKQKDGPVWENPIGMIGTIVGPSLAFRAGTAQPRVRDIMEERRVEAMDDILLHSPILPLKTKALADEIAKRVGSDNPESIRDWLRRRGKVKFPAFVASDNPLEWTHPDRTGE